MQPKRAVEEANELFDKMCQQRHEGGEEEYGHLTWMKNDTLRMLMEELIDASNYARYTFIKLYLLNEHLMESLNEEPSMGIGSFKGTSETWKRL